MEKKGSAAFIKNNPKSLSTKDIVALAIIAFGLFKLFTGRALLGTIACIVGAVVLDSCSLRARRWGSKAMLFGGFAGAISAFARSAGEGMIWVLIGSIFVGLIGDIQSSHVIDEDTKGVKSRPTVRFTSDYSGGSGVMQDEMTPAQKSDAKARQHGFRDAGDAYSHGYNTFAVGDSRSYTTFGNPHTKL